MQEEYLVRFWLRNSDGFWYQQEEVFMVSGGKLKNNHDIAAKMCRNKYTCTKDYAKYSKYGTDGIISVTYI